MQVSWIDAEHLNSLLARIAPAEKPRETPQPDDVPPTLAPIPAEDFGFLTPPAAPVAEVAAEVLLVPDREVASGQGAAPSVEWGEHEADEDESSLPNPGAAVPLSRIRDRLRAIRQSALDAGILTRGAEAAAVAPAFVAAPTSTTLSEPEVKAATAGPSASGTQRERLAAFAAWARTQLQEHGGYVVVMDDHGELLWGGGGNAAMVLSTMMACGAAIRASAAPACGVSTVIRRTLSSGNVLTVIPAAMEAGGLHVAVTGPVALSDEMAERLRGGLQTAMQGLTGGV